MKRAEKLVCREHTRCTPSVLDDGTEIHYTQLKQTRNIYGGTGSTDRECDNCLREIKPGEWVFEYYNTWKREDGVTDIDALPVTICKACEEEEVSHTD